MHKLLAAVLAATLLSANSPAQGPVGAIRGTVLSQSTQEPIPGANIVLLNTTRGASASIEGRFTIPDVPIGTYQLRISAVSSKPVVVSDIVVAVGRPIDLVIRLEESLVDVDEVEVQASYFRRTPDAPVSVQRLSYEEIRRSPGAFEDVVRAVAVLPGVAQAAPGRNDLVVRGGAPSENLFVIDNIEISNINHFGTQGAGGGPLSFINLDFVRETAFSTGGFGVRYGDKMSSVLTIELQDGRNDAIGGRGTISASQFGLDFQGPISEDGSFIFSARRSYLDFIFKAAGFSFVPEYWDFLGRISYRLDNRNNLTVLAVGAIDDVSFFNDDADNRFDNSRVLGTSQRQYVSGVTWQHLLGNGFSRVTLGRTFSNYNGIQRDSLLNPIFTNRSKEGETSLRADLVIKPADATELSFGSQAKLIRFSTDIALPGYETPFGDTLAVRVQGYTSTGYKASGYAQLSQRFLHDFEATVGGRVDYFSLIDTKTYFSPRLSMSYRLTPVTTLAASAGIYRQYPSYIWLVANEQNRGLRAARTDQYILSLEHLLDADLKIRLEGFYKRYRDYPASVNRPYLVLANTGGGFGGTDENFASYGFDELVSAGTGSARGVEFLIQKKLSDIPLYGLLSVTLIQTTFVALDAVERPGAFDQRAIMNVSGGYRFDERWEASMKFRFASGQPYTPFNADGTQNISAYNSLRLKNAHSLDLRVDRRWNFSTWNLIAYLDIQNVYNNKFSGGVRWNAREQRAEFNESSIGILPSIGISVEF
jgi:TonB dependent receptor-like, beta-barrel/Carboxypeptidase regulatory-like domain/TonB-dependent Receptor Plug Domain